VPIYRPARWLPSYAQGYAGPGGGMPPANPGLRDGLVGLWQPTLGPTGGTLFDVSGFGNHGTLTSMDPATDWVGSPCGPTLDFDGTNDHVLIPGVNEDRDNSFSVSLWLSPSSISTTPAQVFGRGYTGNYTGWSIYQTPNVLAWLIPNAALNGWLTAWECNTGTLVNGVWYHVVFIKDGADLTCYLDGVPVDSFAMASAAIGDWGNDLHLGSGVNRSGDATEFWPGKIASVDIVNRALVPSEVQERYRDPHALVRPMRRIGLSAPGVAGPYRTLIAETFHTGAAAGEPFAAAAAAGESFHT